MMKKSYLELRNHLEDWAHQNILNIFIFNICLTLLLLLRSAGYFSPFFPLSIGFIITLCLILLIILWGARSKVLFIIAVFFWVFAAFLRMLGVDIWAERAAIYTFEALILGLLVFFFERTSFKDEA